MEQIFTIKSDALPADAHVVSFVGTEGISTPYRFDIAVQTTDESFDAQKALRARATLLIHQGANGEPVQYHGILAAVELLHQWQGKSLYRLTLVPKLWNLCHMLHSRIFTDNTIVDVIKAVLEHGKLTSKDYRFETMASYPVLEHVCQYKETNLDFIQRRMANDGLYYFFVHGDSQEELVITDSISLHAKLLSGSVRYKPLSGDDAMALEAFDSFKARHAAMPAGTHLTDYDYLHPRLELDTRAPIDTQGVGDITVFGEHFLTDAEGKRYAAVRAEEFKTGQTVFQGRGRVFKLRPNYRFTLEEHPNATYNDHEYLVTDVRHVGNQSASDAATKRIVGMSGGTNDEYWVEVKAIPSNIQYRPPRTGIAPRIDGYELALVCGEAESEYAQIDEHGRYKCRIMFDESDLIDGSATTWVRMMQPHAGSIEGFHFPLRKATEVLLFFLGGNPDRPVIAGAVPNPLTRSPVTNANHTKNVIQTGGRNRLELEDLAGQQRITLSTPYSNTYLRMGSPNEEHEFIARTDDNGLMDIGKNFDHFVGLNGGGSWYTEVQDDVWWFLNAGSFYLDVAAGTLTADIASDTTVTVKGGNTTVNTTGNTDILTTGAMTVKSSGGAVSVNAETGSMAINAKAGIKISTEGDIDQKCASKWYAYSTGDAVKFNFSCQAAMTVGTTNDLKVGIFNEVMVGGKLSVSAGGLIDITAAYKIGVTAAIMLDIQAGAALTLNAAAKLELTSAKIASGQVKIAQKSSWLTTMGIWAGLHGFSALG